MNTFEILATAGTVLLAGYWLLHLISYIARMLWKGIDEAKDTLPCPIDKYVYDNICKKEVKYTKDEVWYKKYGGYGYVYNNLSEEKVYSGSYYLPSHHLIIKESEVEEVKAQFDIGIAPTGRKEVYSIIGFHCVFSSILFFLPSTAWLLYTLYPITLTIALSVGLFYTARLARRTYKKLNTHVNNKEIHNATN